KKDHARRETAVPIDPLADRPRVVAPEHARPRRALDLPALVVEHPSRMESEACALGHADPAAWDRSQQQRARGVAGYVDNDALARMAELGKSVEIPVDPAPGVVVNSNGRRSRRNSQHDKQRAEQNASA